MARLSLDEYTLIVSAIDDLHWRLSTNALKTMCLVHRSIVPLCQKILFSRVNYSPDKMATFLDIVKISPHLADYIRTFRFEFNTRTASVDFPESVDTVLFLDKLRNVNNLSISCPEPHLRGGGVYDWKTLNPDVCDALVRLLHSPKVKHLVVHRFRNFPLRGLVGLRDYSHLRTLNIASVEIDPDSTQSTEGTKGASSNQLTKLTAFPGSASAMEVLVAASASPFENAPIFDFTELRELYTDWDSKREAEASQSVIASAFRLENLSCNLPRDSEATYEGLADAILKGPVKTLRKLNFSSIMSKEIQFNPFFGSIEELTRLSSQVQNLESLFFHFHHKAMNAHDTDHCFLVSEKYKVLDRLLDDAGAFPSLKEVQISFIVSVRNDSRYGIFVLEDEFKAASLDIKECSFQNLKGNATIKFRFDLEMEWS